MKSKHICPHCGGKKFITTAQVVQSLLVDEFGNFIEDKGTNIVVDEPNDDNTWTCIDCGREGRVVDESLIQVEITLEKAMRISKIFDVTEEQLESLKNGINPFEKELKKEINLGYCEYDYSVNTLEGLTIVDWAY